MKEFSTAVFMFIVPGIVANVTHMIIVKKDLFPFLAIPLSEKWLGKNKTLRGFLYLPLAMGIVCLTDSMIAGPFSASHFSDLYIGMGLGLAYMLSELPNSFVKRRVGILSGESSGKFRILQLIIDKADSLTGACIFYYLLMKTEVWQAFALFLFSLLLHISISYLLVLSKLKKSI